LARRNEM